MPAVRARIVQTSQRLGLLLGGLVLGGLLSAAPVGTQVSERPPDRVAHLEALITKVYWLLQLCVDDSAKEGLVRQRLHSDLEALRQELADSKRQGSLRPRE